MGEVVAAIHTDNGTPSAKASRRRLACAACSGMRIFSSRTAYVSPAQLSDDVAAAFSACASAASDAILDCRQQGAGKRMFTYVPDGVLWRRQQHLSPMREP